MRATDPIRTGNAPGSRDLTRLSVALIDIGMDPLPAPIAMTLDIDDTGDVFYGHQHLSLFDAHYDERCFLPIHVYDAAWSRPVALMLRQSKTPSGIEMRGPMAPSRSSYPCASAGAP